METRHVVAYALLALIAVGAAVLAWHLATRASRRRRHERTMRDRWLGLRPPPVAPLPGDRS